MNNRIEKTTGKIFKQRLVIKAFKTSDDMHKFLNSQYDNTWKESKRGLKAGTYAFVGGEYRNVNSLDSSVLAHV